MKLRLQFSSTIHKIDSKKTQVKKTARIAEQEILDQEVRFWVGKIRDHFKEAGIDGRNICYKPAAYGLEISVSIPLSLREKINAITNDAQIALNGMTLEFPRFIVCRNKKGKDGNITTPQTENWRGPELLSYDVSA